MHILRIEHQIKDFDSWKAAFDRDPIGRRQSGVRRHRIFRPVDDPNYVMLDLEFESAGEAEAFRDALERDVWQSRRAAPALVGSPQTRIIEAVENESQENSLRRLWGWLSGQRADEDDPLNKPTEAYGKLEEDRYKAELQLVDRYQSFVAELLRLSLLGIAVFGFLYKEMFTDLVPSPLLTIGGVAKILAAAGVVLFGLAAVAALLFRFAATEGARYYIEGLRFPTDINRAQKSLKMRRKKIGVARFTKPAAGFMLGLGGVLVALSLALLLQVT